MMKAKNLKELDEDFKIHKLAWLTLKVKSTRNKGKEYKYSDFNTFFNYKEKLNKIERSYEANSGDSSKARIDYPNYREYVKNKRKGGNYGD